MKEFESIGSTSELAEKYKTGSAEAGEELALQLRTSLYKRFLRAGVTTHDAEDLCQQCLMDIFTFFDRVDESKGTIDMFTSGVARNVLRNHYRKLSRASQIEGHLESYEELAEEEVDDSAVAAIGAAVDDLNVLDKEILHMRFTLGLDFPEIAVACHLTDHAARKRVSRAVEQVRRHKEVQMLLS